MTDVVHTGPRVASAEVVTERSAFITTSLSGVDWGAILAGTVIATAISFIMAAFGSGVGLSLASPYDGASPMVHAIVLALWVLWITISSYFAGGYVCARMRQRNVEVTRDEAEVRDGAHGLVLWATAIVIVVLAAGLSLYSLGKGAADLAAQEAQRKGLLSNPVDYRVDTLLRGDGDLGGLAPQASASSGNEARQVVTRIVAMSMAKGEVSEEDRSYLVNVLETRAGLSPADAQQRVSAVAGQLLDDNAKAKEAADKARRTGVVLSFISAAGMIVAAAAAWGGAVVGGRHRDQNLGLAHVTRW